ncbi:capsular polysaccharide synthesis protein [Psychrobacter aquimaris]|uniref:capsular polysaccharide synthesis protein n=1 Tax=Psychrobacter aquimaris TaxID=292733 RepID=UPI0018DF097C|nr:capsular polysaccharide synthesis protein [Psychrobacter aquimaris]
MANVEESSILDSSNISPHFFSDSPTYTKLKKLKTKPKRFFYYLSTPRDRRKKFEKEADTDQQCQVAKCWEQFTQLYFDNQLTSYSFKPKKSFSDEKIIWQYWGQGVNSLDLPDIVRLCFKSVDNNSGEYTVIRLDDSNIQDYLDLPEFVWEKRANPQFKHAFFADLLRLALLDVYGGVWLDATIYLSSPLSDLKSQSDFFMYQRDAAKTEREAWISFNRYYFSWENAHKINVLNSIIYAKKHSYVIHTCLNLLLNFWHTQEHIPHYFFFQIMFDSLINNQLSDYQCEIIDDTQTHLLLKVLDERFDENYFKEIVAQINTHKLSYNKQPKEHSFYQHLLNIT